MGCMRFWQDGTFLYYVCRYAGWACEDRLENNIHMASGDVAQNNAQLIEQFRNFSRIANRDIANVRQTRLWL